MGTLDKIGKYEIQEELGRGAMGHVYRALDPDSQRVVAIKTIKSEYLAQQDGQDTLSRFKVEAQAAGKISHPNIVTIYEYGEQDGDVFIVMEYVDGQSLADLLEAGNALSADKACAIMCEVLDGLHCFHDNGVVHRDIKPENIMINKAGRVKITDFGVAHLEASHLIMAGTAIGTPSYMAPEQLTDEGVDHRCDIYSAGAVFYHMLTGQKVFSGNLTTVIQKNLNNKPEKPRSVNKAVSPELEQILLKALDKKASNRFDDAAEFLRAVKIAAPKHDATEVSSVDATMLLKKEEINKAINLGRSNDLWIKLGIAVIAVILAGTGFWYFDKQSDATQHEIDQARELAARMAEKGAARDEKAATQKNDVGLDAELLGGDEDMMALMSESTDASSSATTEKDAMADLMGDDAFNADEPAKEGAMDDKMASVVLTMTTDKGDAPVYAVGEKAVLSVVTDQDAYVHCFYNTEGTVLPVFPNPFHKDSLIQAGNVQEIPSASMKFAFEMTHPNSDEGFACLGFKEDPQQLLNDALGISAFNPIELQGAAIPSFTRIKEVVDQLGVPYSYAEINLITE